MEALVVLVKYGIGSQSVFLRSENGFCVFVDVNEMVINRKGLCKQYASTEKTEVPKHVMTF